MYVVHMLAIAAKLRRQRIDDWWQPARPELKADQQARKHSEELYDPFAMAHPTVAPYLHSIKPIKRTLVVSDILRMATVFVMLAIAATGVAQARPINYEHHHFHAGYAGPMHSRAPRAFNNPSYGCLAHPDYGLYTPHFC
jgi:hypothetical protein